jgi:hypothetical protein
MTRAEIERANAAHNLEATQFISSETIWMAVRQKNFVLPLMIAGLVIAALLLTGYLYREIHPTTTRSMPGRVL